MLERKMVELEDTGAGKMLERKMLEVGGLSWTRRQLSGTGHRRAAKSGGGGQKWLRDLRRLPNVSEPPPQGLSMVAWNRPSSEWGSQNEMVGPAAGSLTRPPESESAL